MSVFGGVRFRRCHLPPTPQTHKNKHDKEDSREIIKVEVRFVVLVILSHIKELIQDHRPHG